MSEGNLLWQGGAEVREGGGNRLGILVLYADELFFLVSGRSTGSEAAKVLGVGAALFTLVPVAIEAFASTVLAGDKGLAPAILQPLAVLVAVTLGYMAVRAWQQDRQVKRDFLASFAEPSPAPQRDMLLELCEQFPGSVRVPIPDIADARSKGAQDVELQTVGQGRLVLRVAPDRDAFVEHLQGARS